MKQIALVLLCLVLGACSKKVKEVVDPPDNVGTAHSNSNYIGDSSSSAQSSLIDPPTSSSQAHGNRR